MNVSPDKKKVFLQDDECLLNCVKEITNELYPVRVTPVEEDEGNDDSEDTSSSSPLGGVLSQRLKEAAPVVLTQSTAAGGQRLFTYDGDSLLDSPQKAPRTTQPLVRLVGPSSSTAGGHASSGSSSSDDLDVSQPRECLKEGAVGMKRPSPPPPQLPQQAGASKVGSPLRKVANVRDVPDKKKPVVGDDDEEEEEERGGVEQDRLYGRDSIAVARSVLGRGNKAPPALRVGDLASGLAAAFRQWTQERVPAVFDHTPSRKLQSPTFGHRLSVVGVCQQNQQSTKAEEEGDECPESGGWCFVVREAITDEQWNFWFMRECTLSSSSSPSTSGAAGGSGGAGGATKGRARVVWPTMARGEQLLSYLVHEHQTHCPHRKPRFVPLCTVYLKKSK